MSEQHTPRNLRVKIIRGEKLMKVTRIHPHTNWFNCSKLLSVPLTALTFLSQEDNNDNFCRLTLYDVPGKLITSEKFETKVTD